MGGGKIFTFAAQSPIVIWGLCGNDFLAWGIDGTMCHC